MSQQSAFQMQHRTQVFTAATTAPTPVQVTSVNAQTPTNACNYVLTNIGTQVAFVSCEATAALATSSAVIPTAGGGTNGARCIPVLGNSQISLTGPPAAFFTGITSSGTATVYVSGGEGL